MVSLDWMPELVVGLYHCCISYTMSNILSICALIYCVFIVWKFVTSVTNGLTSEQWRQIRTKVPWVICWCLASLCFGVGLVFLTFNWDFFGWRGPQYDKGDLFIFTDLIVCAKLMMAASRRINDKVTRVVALLPAACIAYAGLSVVNHRLTVAERKGILGDPLPPSQWTPLWFGCMMVLLSFIPLVMWILTFEKDNHILRSMLNELTGSKTPSPEGQPNSGHTSHTHDGSSTDNGSGQEYQGDIKDQLRQALAKLELSNRVTRTEVREAYRNLAQIWHPDRFSHNPKLQELAQKKLCEINNAYDFLEDYFKTKNGSKRPE